MSAKFIRPFKDQTLVFGIGSSLGGIPILNYSVFPKESLEQELLSLDSNFSLVELTNYFKSRYEPKLKLCDPNYQFIFLLLKEDQDCYIFHTSLLAKNKQDQLSKTMKTQLDADLVCFHYNKSEL